MDTQICICVCTDIYFYKYKLPYVYKCALIMAGRTLRGRAYSLRVQLPIVSWLPPPTRSTTRPPAP